MLTKTRTVIITLIVTGSLSFAIGPLASVAGAAKNNGSYQQEQKAKLCRQVAGEYTDYENAVRRSRTKWRNEGRDGIS